MRTIIIKTIDGYEVVKGIGYPALDPVSTRLAVKPLLDACEEGICLLNKKQVSAEIIRRAWDTSQIKRAGMYEQSRVAWNAGMILWKQTQEYIIHTNLLVQMPVPADRTDEENQAVVDAQDLMQQKKEELVTEINQAFFETDEYQTFISLLDSEKQVIKDGAAVMAQKRMELTRDNAVYFTPRAGEMIVDDTEGTACETQLAALTAATVLSRNPDTTALNVITDLRGSEYWDIDNDRWRKNQIMVLDQDIPAGGILTADLTTENRTEIGEEAEEDRVAALSSTEKQTEYDAAVSALTGEMINYRSGLEIGGTSAADALTQSQALSATRDQELQTKYGIE